MTDELGGKKIQLRRQTLTSSANVSVAGATRTTFEENSPFPGHGLRVESANLIFQLVAHRILAMTSEAHALREKSMVMASSNHGICAGRTRTGTARAASGCRAFRVRCEPHGPFHCPLACSSNCMATANVAGASQKCQARV